MKDLILSKLDKVQGNGTKYRACCPAHNSKGRTLSLLFNPDGRILIHCHAGCGANEVLESIGLSLSDLYPDGAIRDFMASATVQNKVSSATHEDFVLDIYDEKRNSGEKLTPAEIIHEQKAYLRNRK